MFCFGFGIRNYLAINCSTIGPSDRAGKKLRAPTSTVTATSQKIKRALWVGRVPLEAGTVFLLARDPAMARAGMASQYLETSITIPRARLKNRLLVLSPAKALPLLFAADEKA
jgi:hypothetical protein